MGVGIPWKTAKTSDMRQGCQIQITDDKVFWFLKADVFLLIVAVLILSLIFYESITVATQRSTVLSWTVCFLVGGGVSIRIPSALVVTSCSHLIVYGEARFKATKCSAKGCTLNELSIATQHLLSAAVQVQSFIIHNLISPPLPY